MCHVQCNQLFPTSAKQTIESEKLDRKSKTLGVNWQTMVNIKSGSYCNDKHIQTIKSNTNKNPKTNINNTNIHKNEPLLPTY